MANTLPCPDEGDSSLLEAPATCSDSQHDAVLARRYKIKYKLLVERCRALQQDNERLVNRILDVKKLCRIGLRHRSAIMKRLDVHGDNFRNVPVIIHPEKESGNCAGGLASSSLTSSASVLASPLAAEWAMGSPDNSRRTSASRDPGLPKRPHAAFFYFSQETRPKLQKDYPELSKKEIAGMLSSTWSKLTSDEKQPFIKLEEVRRREYRLAMQRYKDQQLQSKNF